ncbi:galactokinase [Anaerosolibacter carboniphilus]|uniref:Galactokinase n=1 Tax=Anaerosolibacter carboniphilus TaxID=1417629 RepID=A0A841KSW7_9FIRM|nr:galactokinase [Anaerosolibacter carboniphilus]MBB6215248.1 galactokinase [Anaerosolibacter carboniphilus]
MKLETLIQDFTRRFGDEGGILTFFAPGRVNLIGEHTDYNGGHVFPCALSFGTYAIARKRKDTKIQLFSKNFEDFGQIETDINHIIYDPAYDWANYPIGMVKTFKDAGYTVASGFDVLYYGNIPNGAGLSSSASIELVTSVLLKSLFDLDIEMMEMVQLSQKAENQFVGVNCGIMDQFASGMGKKDHAMLLDTNTLKYEYVPIKAEGITIVIANTNKRRSLAGSKYNERRSECENALKALQKELAISSLGDLTEERFDAHKHLIESEIEQKRAKHAVYENQRTLKAVKALNAGDIQLFGKLMNASHISLRDDYEVTGIELDTLVEAAWANGAIGSRMTGAGFGGCTVSLVHQDQVENFIEKVGRAYEEKIGYKAEFYVVAIGDGARQL